MSRAMTCAVASLAILGCTGEKGPAGAPAEQRKVFDGNGAELGVLVGTSMAWGESTNGPYPVGQMLSYEDANGVVWNVAAGGGMLQLPLASLFFESADCTGPVLLRNASPYVPMASIGGASQGVYQATTVAATADPQSWISANTGGVCITSAPAPNPPPAVTVYRNAVRLGDFPMAPKAAPITIGP